MNWSPPSQSSDDATPTTSSSTLHFTDPVVIDSLALAEQHQITTFLRRQIKGTWQFSFNKIDKENGLLFLRLALRGVFAKSQLSTVEFIVGVLSKISCFHGVEFDITGLETGKKNSEMIEATLVSLLNSIEASCPLSLRLVLPQYKRLIKYYNNRFDSRFNFIHIVVEPAATINRPASATGHKRKSVGSAQSLTQRSLRIPFYELCGDPASLAVLYKSETFSPSLDVDKHIDLVGPVYAAHDLQVESPNKYLAPTPRRLIASSPNLLSYHSNNSGLTLHKVSAIQTALDDNKSPTFGTLKDGIIEAYPQRPPGLASNIRYGWAILFATWTIVILGITSVMGMWDSYLESFLYAPIPRDLPSGKFEKETGYPIQNYYPCLIFVTFIASWVWCIISWMGMKFFRHTKGGLATNGTNNNEDAKT